MPVCIAAMLQARHLPKNMSSSLYSSFYSLLFMCDLRASQFFSVAPWISFPETIFTSLALYSEYRCLLAVCVTAVLCDTHFLLQCLK